MSSLDFIEENQGIVECDRPRVFGFDHKRLNFIAWGLDESGKIVPAFVEPDEKELRTGSLAATLRDAKRIAARENRLERSSLRDAIENAERRALQ